MTQPLTDGEAALVEAVLLSVARQRLKLQQKQQDRKAGRQ
jgi:hypothetical protein